MAPKENDKFETEKVNDSEEEEPQYLYIVRHGDRFDYENPEWSKNSPRPGDPPLSQLGHLQARETGLFLDQLFHEDGIAAEDITWLSSPFLRCLQTSTEALHALTLAQSRQIKILPEYSVFEWDGKGGSWHASLPPLEERRHYFPRLVWNYKSLFVPSLPEPRQAFHQRCERAILALEKRYPYRSKSVLVVVTHAAACIGLTHAATRCGSFTEINPAAPCGVYRLSRTRHHDWTMDACDKPGRNLNGHTDHLSSMDGATTAWNHFGDPNQYKGYSGPLTSKFAPPELRKESF